MNANQCGGGTRLTETRLKHKWVGWDSNPEPTPKAFGAARLLRRVRPYRKASTLYCSQESCMSSELVRL